MKRNVITKLLACATAFAAVLPLVADTETVNGVEWNYTVSDGKAEIIYIDYDLGQTTAISTLTTGDLIIPSMLGGCPVTSIGDSAFIYCSGLTSVMIPDGVTSIGWSAFQDCSSIMSVMIPDSVTSIGGAAFYNCSGLTSVTIPDSVTSIDEAAFEGCDGLKNVTIGKGVTIIGRNVFYGCSSLTSVTIPDSVTSVEGGAFFGCNSSLFDTTTILGVNLVDGWAVGFADSLSGNLDLTGIRGIGVGAFSGCTNMTSVTIPYGVTGIGDGTFSGCSGLKSVAIPGSVTSIGRNAFENCSGLTSVTISDSVTSIGYGAFSGCGALMSFSVAYGNAKYLSSSGLLLSKDGETLIAGVNGDVVIPNGVISIEYEAFLGRSGLTSVTIPDSVTSIGYGAFSDCGGLVLITVGKGNPNYSSENGLLMSKDGKTLIQGVNGDVTIPDSVTSIEYGAFSGCGGLVSITVGKGNPNYSSENGLLMSKDGKTLIQGVNGDVTIPDSVTSIGEEAFYHCSGLTSVVIPDSVTSIGWNAFSDCNALVSITVGKGNPNYSSANGLLMSKDGKTLIQGVNGDVTIPDNVTSVGEWAFLDCGGLTSVTIPDSVTSIGYGAFFGCSGLTSVVIPDSVTIIDYEAFSYCSRLANVTIPNSVKRIESEAFYETALATVYTAPGDTKRVKALIEDSGQNMHGITFVEVTQPVPTPDPTPAPGTDPTPTPEPGVGHALFEEIQGSAPAVAASEYNGYLSDASGIVKGTIQVKVGKPGKKDGKAAVKATVIIGPKKVTLKAADKGKAVINANGSTEIELVGGEACAVKLGAEGVSGKYGAYFIDGARNFFASKAKEEQAAANAVLGKWQGPVNVVWGGGSVNITIAKKGKAKVKGTLASGAKVSAKSTFLVGKEWCAVPVSAPKANLTFTLWLSRDGRAAMVEGLGNDVHVGKPGTLAANAAFHVSKTDALWSSVPGSVLKDYIPDGAKVPSNGGKWVLPKAGKVVYKDGAPDQSKLGENPSGLKLTYKAKDGSFKGSFKVYAVDGGKVKATTVNITGMMAKGVGYGTATIKGKGSVSVTVE